jgi:hypothetical protein
MIAELALTRRPIRHLFFKYGTHAPMVARVVCTTYVPRNSTPLAPTKRNLMINSRQSGLM